MNMPLPAKSDMHLGVKAGIKIVRHPLGFPGLKF